LDDRQHVPGGVLESGDQLTTAAERADRDKGPLLHFVIEDARSGLNGVTWKQAADFSSLPNPPAPQW
jgi:hypothetical protein